MAFTLPSLIARATDNNGKVIDGARLYVFFANTETPAPFYTDTTLSVAHPHPLEAAFGLWPAVFLAAGYYKIRLTTDTGATLWTVDDYRVDSEGSELSFPPVTKTMNFSLSAADRGKVFLCNAVGAPGQNISISADSETLSEGFPFFVVKTGASGTVTVQGVTAQTVDGQPSVTLTEENSSLGLVSIGATGWVTVMKSNVNDFTTPVTFSSSVTFSQQASIIGGPLNQPSGRPTLVSGEPYHAQNILSQSTVYFSPCNGNRMPIFDGVGWKTVNFSETSQALGDGAKSPSPSASNTVYHLFAWLDGSTFRVTRGPAWASPTSPGTGAGTSELEIVDGVHVNKHAIANGPAAMRGTMVGCIATDAANQMSMTFDPAAALGGSANRLDVWSTFNQRQVSSVSRDNTDSWTYTGAVWRAANNSVSNRVTFVQGLSIDSINAVHSALAGNAANNELAIAGVGLDSTSLLSGYAGHVRTQSTPVLPMSVVGSYNGFAGVGLHFVQAIERTSGGGTGSWFGDNGAAGVSQATLTLTISN
jgi:hypothetical protein